MKKSDPRPKRGRPVDIHKRDQILDVASAHFMDKGFHATSMDDIAQNAGMSKLTLYRRFPDKNALFRAVIERKCKQFVPHEMSDELAGLQPAEFVQQFSKMFLMLIMSDDAVNIYRMMMAEAANNPDMTRMFYEAGPVPVKTVLDQAFTGYSRKGFFKKADTVLMRECLLSLLNGSEMHLKATLNIGEKPTVKQIEQEAKRKADFFVSYFL
jgi:TetR/AcrR family transcriptional repressor of mexJK operon